MAPDETRPVPQADASPENFTPPPQDLGAGHLSEVERQQQKLALTINATQLALAVPPPEVIKGYLEFYPDAAEKFFQWAEEESRHRRALDCKLVDSQIEDSRRGMNYGLVVSLAGLAVAGFAVWMDSPWAASIIGGGALVALARAFIVGKNLALRRSGRTSPKKS